MPTKSRWSLVIVAILSLCSLTLAQEKNEVRTLEPDKPVERELAGDEVHYYQATLSAGQFLTVIVDQRGIDAVVKLFDPDETLLSQVDSPNGIRGPEIVSVLAKQSGSYRLEVFALEKKAPAGRYEIRIDELREATVQDRTIDLAAALAMARTEEERTALISKDNALLTPDLERLLVQHGEGLTRRHEYQRALALYQIALGIAEKRESKPAAASILSKRGLTLWQMGDYTQALGSYHRSMALLEELGDRLGIVRTLYNLGLVHTSQGNYDLALEYNRKYLAVAEALHDKRMIAQAMPSMGIAYSAQGDYIRAMEYYQKALALFQELGDQGGVVAALQDIAGIYGAQNNNGLALEYYQRSLAMTEAAFRGIPTDPAMPANRFAAGALLDMGTIYSKEGDYTKALEFSLRSLEMARALKNPAMIASALSNSGQAYSMQGNYAKALEFFQEALRLGEENGDKVAVAQLLATIGGAHFSLGNYADAIKFEERSTELASKLGNPETLWYSRMIAGRAYQSLGKPTQARQALDEAITTIEGMRTHVAGPELAQQTFFEDKVGPYHAMTELLVSQNDAAEAFQYLERSKARVLLDVLQRGKVDITKDMTVQERERERALNNELVSLNTRVSHDSQGTQTEGRLMAELKTRLEKTRLEYESFQTDLYIAHPQLKIQRGKAQPIRLEEAARLLPDATAALEFMVTGDRTYLFVLTKSSENNRVDLKPYPLALTFAQIAERAERFREQLALGDLDFQASARELYDLLLKPAQDQLQGKTTLIIVPDSVLWNLPFQALQSAPNHYVLEDHALFYAPSLTVLREMTKARSLQARKSQHEPALLAFGNPSISKQTTEGLRRISLDEKLEPLPEAEKQVMALGQLYGPSQSKVYTGFEAREDRAKKESGGYRIVQFATHGVLNDRNPMYSHLVLSQTQNDNKEDGLLEAREMLSLDLHADLVVLSACETGLGRIGAGEGIIGMSWALFVAGSPATIVSQWKVESASTTELMLAFHRNLKSGGQMTKAKALQQAAMKLLRDGKYAHPFYWAGFVVVGNGF
jgi:CHAT domain-containing protein